MATRQLSRPYAAAGGVPTIDRVDLAVFRRRYFTKCMECGFCADACCQYGTEIDVVNIERILVRAADVERLTGRSRDEWFGELQHDDDFPGGAYRRTRVIDDRCVFHRTGGRGCLLHSAALDGGGDPHELKPMLCSLFPLSYDDGLLHPAEEVVEDELVCLGDGETLYRGVRSELEHVFGTAFVRELDALEALG